MARTAQQVRDAAKKLFDEGQGLLAKREEGSLTEDEQKRFGEIESELAKLEEELNLIERIDNHRERENRFRQAVNPGAAVVPATAESTDEQRSRDELAIFPTEGHFLKSVKRSVEYGQADQQMSQYRTMLERRDIATGLQEDVDSEGGFLVPQTFSNELMRLTHESGLVASRCRVVPMTTKRVTFPALDETSRADGSRWGGVRGYWEGEAASLTASRPKFKELSLDAKKVTALVYSTDELLEDATALSAFIRMVVPEELAFKLDDAIINGDGGGKPLGVVGANGTVDQAKETGQAAATILYENLINMYSRLLPRAISGAVWFANSDILPELMNLQLAVGTGGSAVWLPAGGAVGAPNDTLFGKPLIYIEHAQTLGTTGDLILGDFSQYLLARKGGTRAAQSIHVQFLTAQTVFRFIQRVDGQPWLQTALTPFTGTATKANFITLATRA